MRTILGVIVLFALAIGAALLAAGNDGYILIILQDLRLQVTLNLAIVVLVATFFLLYFLVRLLDNLLRLPDGLREARARRRASRAHRALTQGLTHFLDGHFAQAQKAARIACKNEEDNGAAALLAAYAAHDALDDKNAARWLEVAAEHAPAAAEIARARFALRDEDAATAEAALRALKERGHSAPVVERLEIALANLRRQPQTLVPAVDSLARIRMIAPERADRLRDEAWLATLAEKAADPEAQREYWRGLPKASLARAEFLRQAVLHLSAGGQAVIARRQVEKVLNSTWDSDLARVYHLCAGEGEEARDALKNAEHWQQRHGDDASLLYSLGCQCAQMQIWGKAQAYLERAAEIAPQADVFLALGSLLETLDRPQEAAQYFRRAACAVQPALS